MTWYKLFGYEEIYEINKRGDINSKRRTGATGGILSGTYNKLGYKMYLLSKNGKKKSFFGHRLVAINFIPNPLNLPYVNHKDENPLNNNVENLEWCDAKYNTNYGGAIQRRSESRFKELHQLDLDGNILKVWKSGTHAAKILNFKHGKISEVANGKRKTAYGYKWSYYKE